MSVDDRLATVQQAWSNSRPAIRLRMKSTGALPGYFDGGWWPRSSDPGPELEALIGAIETLGRGVVQQLLVNTTGWTSTPASVAVGRRVVPVNWLPACATTTARVIVGVHRHQFDLLIVPASTNPQIAAVALASASQYTSTGDGVDILAAAAHTTDTTRWSGAAVHRPFPNLLLAPQGWLEEARWETDGGRVRA